MKAVQASGGTIPDAVLASPTFINLGTALTSSTITLSQTGTTPPTVTDAASNAAWLTVTAASVISNGIGTYNVTIDRSTGGLADNDYSGTITFTLSNATTVAVDVAMQVRSVSDQIGDTGFMYILLVDPNNTFITVRQTELSATAGVYNYQFSNVAAGSYQVVGGSDIDNDGFICDIGESCGSYPVLNEFFVLDINDETGNPSDLDFISTVISGVTNRTGAIAGAPVEGFKLMRSANRTHKTLGGLR